MSRSSRLWLGIGRCFPLRHPLLQPGAATGPKKTPAMRRGFDGVGGGDEGTRTPYLSDANAALSQMSYVPTNNEPLHRRERSATGSTVVYLLRAVGRTSPDAIARLSCELSFLSALLAPSRREFPSWRFQYPVVDTVGNHLERLSLGHDATFPLSVQLSLIGQRLTTPPPASGSVVSAIDRFNRLSRFVQHARQRCNSYRSG